MSSEEGSAEMSVSSTQSKCSSQSDDELELNESVDKGEVEEKEETTAAAVAEDAVESAPTEKCDGDVVEAGAVVAFVADCAMNEHLDATDSGAPEESSQVCRETCDDEPWSCAEEERVAAQLLIQLRRLLQCQPAVVIDRQRLESYLGRRSNGRYDSLTALMACIMRSSTEEVAQLGANELQKIAQMAADDVSVGCLVMALSFGYSWKNEPLNGPFDLARLMIIRFKELALVRCLPLLQRGVDLASCLLEASTNADQMQMLRTIFSPAVTLFEELDRAILSKDEAARLVGPTLTADARSLATKLFQEDEGVLESACSLSLQLFDFDDASIVANLFPDYELAIERLLKATTTGLTFNINDLRVLATAKKLLIKEEYVRDMIESLGSVVQMIDIRVPQIYFEILQAALFNLPGDKQNDCLAAIFNKYKLKAISTSQFESFGSAFFDPLQEKLMRKPNEVKLKDVQFVLVWGLALDYKRTIWRAIQCMMRNAKARKLIFKVLRRLPSVWTAKAENAAEPVLATALRRVLEKGNEDRYISALDVDGAAAAFADIVGHLCSGSPQQIMPMSVALDYVLKLFLVSLDVGGTDAHTLPFALAAFEAAVDKGAKVQWAKKEADPFEDEDAGKTTNQASEDTVDGMWYLKWFAGRLKAPRILNEREIIAQDQIRSCLRALATRLQRDGFLLDQSALSTLKKVTLLDLAWPLRFVFWTQCKCIVGNDSDLRIQIPSALLTRLSDDLKSRYTKCDEAGGDSIEKAVDAIWDLSFATDMKTVYEIVAGMTPLDRTAAEGGLIASLAQKVISGVVPSSFWSTQTDNNIDAHLALILDAFLKKTEDKDQTIYRNLIVIKVLISAISDASISDCRDLISTVTQRVDSLVAALKQLDNAPITEDYVKEVEMSVASILSKDHRKMKACKRWRKSLSLLKSDSVTVDSSSSEEPTTKDIREENWDRNAFSGGDSKPLEENSKHRRGGLLHIGHTSIGSSSAAPQYGQPPSGMRHTAGGIGRGELLSTITQPPLAVKPQTDSNNSHRYSQQRLSGPTMRPTRPFAQPPSGSVKHGYAGFDSANSHTQPNRFPPAPNWRAQNPFPNQPASSAPVKSSVEGSWREQPSAVMPPKSPYGKTDRLKDTIECFKCNATGHPAETCPRVVVPTAAIPVPQVNAVDNVNWPSLPERSGMAGGLGTPLIPINMEDLGLTLPRSLDGHGGMGGVGRGKRIVNVEEPTPLVQSPPMFDGTAMTRSAPKSTSGLEADPTMAKLMAMVDARNSNPMKFGERKLLDHPVVQPKSEILDEQHFEKPMIEKKIDERYPAKSKSERRLMNEPGPLKPKSQRRLNEHQMIWNDGARADDERAGSNRPQPLLNARDDSDWRSQGASGSTSYNPQGEPGAYTVKEKKKQKPKFMSTGAPQQQGRDGGGKRDGGVNARRGGRDDHRNGVPGTQRFPCDDGPRHRHPREFRRQK